MVGESSVYDPRNGRVSTSLRPRDPNVEGPGGFFFGDAQAPGALTFVAPSNGQYRFSTLRDVGRAGERQDLRPVTLRLTRGRLPRLRMFVGSFDRRASYGAAGTLKGRGLKGAPTKAD
jgi:hypothetical protein